MSKHMDIRSRFLALLAVSLLVPAVTYGKTHAPAQSNQTAMVEGERQMDEAAAERKMLQGAGEMMDGRRIVLRTLKKEGQGEDRSVKDSARSMAEGDRMILRGGRLWMREHQRARGEGLVMNGATKMMESKDRMVTALEKDGLAKLASVQKGERLLDQGLAKLLEGKNALDQGEKSSLE
jgi:hypothetical protein